MASALINYLLSSYARMSVGQQRYLMSLCQHLLAIPTFWWVFEVSCKSDSYQMEKMSVVGKAKRVESPSHCCCQCQCQCLASSHHWLSDEGSPSLMNANAAVKPIYVTHLRSVNVKRIHAVNSPSYSHHLLTCATIIVRKPYQLSCCFNSYSLMHVYRSQDFCIIGLPIFLYNMMMINSNLKSLKQRVFWVEFSR